MTFSPSIQSLVGAHSGDGNIAVDWSRNRVFEFTQGSNHWLSRYGLLSGLEEAWINMDNMGGTGTNGLPAHIGLAANGNIFISASNSLYAGAGMYVNGSTLAMINFIPYNLFEQGGMDGITFGNVQYCVDIGVGGSIGNLNNISEISTTTQVASQPFTGPNGGTSCAGPAGAGIGYVFSLDNSGTSATLSKIRFDSLGRVANTVVGTVTQAMVDTGWSSHFAIMGMCLDQTDNKLLVAFSGVGAGTRGRLVKVNPTTAAVEWVASVPNTAGGGPFNAGPAFRHSDITHQRIAIFTSSPPTVTIINTATGAVVSTYTAGLTGVSDSAQGQCYSDTLGGIVMECPSFTSGAGSPALLNSTPSSFSGWSVLYVDTALAPATPGSPGGPATSRKRAWTFTLDGHVFYVLDLGQEGTWLYDTSTGEWSNFYTSAYAQWNVTNGCMWGNRIVGGDLLSSNIYEVAASNLQDNGSVDVPHCVTGGLETRSRARFGCDAVLLSVSLGDLDNVAGSAMNMRYSDDNGQTWSAYYTISMVEGDYTAELRWRSLGSFGAPGRIFEFSDVGGPRGIDGCDAFVEGFDSEKSSAEG